jgi:hypothetical protein
MPQYSQETECPGCETGSDCHDDHKDDQGKQHKFCISSCREIKSWSEQWYLLVATCAGIGGECNRLI